jgi:hypothetical protein
VKAFKDYSRAKAQKQNKKKRHGYSLSEQSNQFAQQTIQVQMQADEKQKAITEGEMLKRKKNKERQDRLTLADKIAGDQELQMLVNSETHDKNFKKLGR